MLFSFSPKVSFCLPISGQVERASLPKRSTLARDIRSFPAWRLAIQGTV